MATLGMSSRPIMTIISVGTMLGAFVFGVIQLGLVWVVPPVLIYWLARTILDLRLSDAFIRETIGGKFFALIGLLIVNAIVYSLVYGVGWAISQILD